MILVCILLAQPEAYSSCKSHYSEALQCSGIIIKYCGSLPKDFEEKFSKVNVENINILSLFNEVQIK